MTTILSHPDAPEGHVSRLPNYSATTFPLGSVVLCRNTAPLVAHAYGLLHRDVPCRILGRDIGKQLTDIVTKRRPANLADLEEKLKIWHDREVQAAMSAGRSPERIHDQYDCLCYFIAGLDDESRSVPSLLAKIDLMFSDSGDPAARVTLSTIHRAKGGEWTTVFLLDFAKLLPSRFATQPWQLQQERNLQYVAVTRSKLNLHYISSDTWKE